MKIMLIGASGAGKTTLIQRLQDNEIKYDKTQAIEYVGNFIDTPGEYMQNRWFWGPLTVTACDADLIGFVHDSTDEDCWFNNGLSYKFERPCIGIITKIDCPGSNPSRSRNFLEYAGIPANSIYETSSYDGSGIDALSEAFHRILDK